MDQFTQELRLLWFLGVNALLLVSIARACFAFAGNRRSWLLLDVLLFNYVVEYALVCGLGVLGLLTPVNLSIGAGLIAASLLVLFRKTCPMHAPALIGKSALFTLLFAVGYEVAYLIYRRDLPVLETDALAYHLPVAIEWLRSAHLPILQTWYWNPTNTYSPMGAEAFVAWLIAPMGSDLFARWVQAPALVMVLLAMFRIGRILGASAYIAACVAAGTVLSRSFFSQASIVKDDLLLAAIFVTAVAALADVPEAKRYGDRLSPWRAGCAVGLLVATKYPALIALPMLLLVMGPALRQWRKGELAVAGLVAVALCGPWFVRNAIEFHNPLYPLILKPLFPGLFRTVPDPAMRTPAGIWHMMTGGYFGTPAAFICGVGALWLLGMIGAQGGEGFASFDPALRRTSEPASGEMGRSALGRFAGVGAIGGVVFYAIASPYPEVRYFLPFFLPFYAGAARGLIVLKRWAPLQGVAAVALVIAATCTTFEISSIAYVLRFAGEAAILAGVALGLILLWRVRRGAAIALVSLAMLILAGVAYVQFNSFASGVADGADAIWSRPDTYGELGEGWAFVRHHLPIDATIAYANTNLIDPLYGPAGKRRLVYVPVRPGIHTHADLPPFGEHIPQDQIFQATTAAMNQNADLATWLENLRQSRADFLFMAKYGSAENPPEAGFVAALGWKPIFENGAAAVYQVRGVGSR